MRTWFLNKLKRFSELTWITNNSLSNVDLAMFSSKLLHVVQFQSCLGKLKNVKFCILINFFDGCTINYNIDYTLN